MRTGALAAAVVFVAACLHGARADDAHPLERASAVLAAVAPHVEKACGAKFESAPRVVELSAWSAKACFVEDLRPEYERRYPSLTERQRETLLDLGARTSVQSVVARYSFSRREVVVCREGFDAQTSALKIGAADAAHLLSAALAHECVHALDDARFGLARIYRDVKDDESLRAVAMVAEGRAVHFGRIAAVSAGTPRAMADLLPGGASPRETRDWHLHLTYRLGARFVAALVERGGTALADAALATPPASTWLVCDPARWPDARPDERPAKALARAGLAEETRPLSNLQLLERYAAQRDLASAETLFAGFRGGAQALVGGTNCAVLAFADEDGAKAYAERSAAEAPTARRGTLVARAAGEEQDTRLATLVEALAEPAADSR